MRVVKEGGGGDGERMQMPVIAKPWVWPPECPFPPCPTFRSQEQQTHGESNLGGHAAKLQCNVRPARIDLYQLKTGRREKGSKVDMLQRALATPASNLRPLHHIALWGLGSQACPSAECR